MDLGGARGLAHIGVLQVLEEEDIPIDMIAGASAGSVIGALYTQGKDARSIKNLAMELLNWRRLVSLADLIFPLALYMQYLLSAHRNYRCS